MKDFDGKVALVTGGASGIGRTIALLYANQGARVVVSDIDDAGGQDTVNSIVEAGVDAVYMHADVSKPEDCMRVVGEALARYDRLDCACNNAGIGGEQNPIAQLSIEGWDRTVSINLSGVFYCMLRDPGHVEELEMWNLYEPQWAQISIVPEPHKAGNKCLELRDEDPYDYALGERAFPESARIRIEFRVLAVKVGHGILECEVQDRRGSRILKLRLDDKWLNLDQVHRWVNPIPLPAREWLSVQLDLDCVAGKYDLTLSGKLAARGVKFAEKVHTVERMVFRTGPYRGDVRAIFVEGEHETLGLTREDFAGADQRVPLSVYWIDDVKTSGSPGM